MLYDIDNFALVEAKELTAMERQHLAQEDFDHGFYSAVTVFVLFEFNANRGECRSVLMASGC